ncbi:hypothetical protein K470DRAFT_267719 [Piedraia hortae CBS 480.64]|uniref:Uncharacterized protein n=1 Tax=Piedraia hortae CBS 480.64 TaxID=1314780 RepID=A0A6A7C9Q8_9PEZI|nr:hypothetical protein K470DRAFT_267719 [Piedraia hortae CBS 480.64]
MQGQTGRRPPWDEESAKILKHQYLAKQLSIEYDKNPEDVTIEMHLKANWPLVIRLAASRWTAAQLWSASYLQKALTGHKVPVLPTVNGNADPRFTATNGERLCVPLIETVVEPFNNFIDKLLDPRGHPPKESYCRFNLHDGTQTAYPCPIFWTELPQTKQN